MKKTNEEIKLNIITHDTENEDHLKDLLRLLKLSNVDCDDIDLSQYINNDDVSNDDLNSGLEKLVNQLDEQINENLNPIFRKIVKTNYRLTIKEVIALASFFINMSLNGTITDFRNFQRKINNMR